MVENVVWVLLETYAVKECGNRLGSDAVAVTEWVVPVFVRDTVYARLIRVYQQLTTLWCV